MTAETYLVPRLPFTQRETLREFLFECIDALDEHGFEFVESAHRESDTTRLTRFSDEPETSHLELWEDYLGRVRYLRLESADEASLAQLTTVVAQRIPIESHEQLCAAATDSSEPSLLFRIGYSAPRELASTTLQVVVRALESNSPPLLSGPPGVDPEGPRSGKEGKAASRGVARSLPKEALLTRRGRADVGGRSSPS